MKQFRAYVITILVIAANLVAVGCGQRQQNPSGSLCLNQLAPCLNYLNGNDEADVPDSCCDPLKNMIKSRPECLCSMMSNRGSREAERAGINVTQAQQLPGRCGQHVNPLVCLPGSPNSKTSVENSAFPLFTSHSTIIVIALSMALQVLLLMKI